MFTLIAVCGALTALLSGALIGVPVARAADGGRGRILFLRCASCHDITPGASAKIGPNLHGVVGRHVASLPGYAYSAALRAQDFVWDAPHLDRWLTNPNGVAPGTIMAFAGIAEESDRRAIIEFLETQSAAPSTGARQIGPLRNMASLAPRVANGVASP